MKTPFCKIFVRKIFVYFLAILNFYVYADVLIKKNTSNIETSRIAAILKGADSVDKVYSILNKFKNIFHFVQVYKVDKNIVVEIEQSVDIQKVIFRDKNNILDLKNVVLKKQYIGVIDFKPGFTNMQNILIYIARLKCFFVIANRKSVDISYTLAPIEPDSSDLKTKSDGQRKYVLNIFFNQSKRLPECQVHCVGNRIVKNKIIKKSILAGLKNHLISADQFVLDPTIENLKELAYLKGLLKFNIRQAFYYIQGSLMHVFLLVDEGPRFVCRKVVVNFKDNIVPYKFKYRKLDTYNSSDDDWFISKIKKFYSDKGMLVDVKTNHKLSEDVIDLYFEVSRKELFLISEIFVFNNNCTNYDVILKASDLKIGTYCDDATLRAAKFKILSLGLFSSVDVVFENDISNRAKKIIKIYVNELKNVRFSLNFAWGNSVNARNFDFGVNLIHPNLFGTGNYLNIGYQLGTTRALYKIDYSMTRVRSSLVDLSFGVEYSQNENYSNTNTVNVCNMPDIYIQRRFNRNESICYNTKNFSFYVEFNFPVFSHSYFSSRVAIDLQNYKLKKTAEAASPAFDFMRRNYYKDPVFTKIKDGGYFPNDGIRFVSKVILQYGMFFQPKYYYNLRLNLGSDIVSVNFENFYLQFKPNMSQTFLLDQLGDNLINFRLEFRKTVNLAGVYSWIDNEIYSSLPGIVNIGPKDFRFGNFVGGRSSLKLKLEFSTKSIFPSNFNLNFFVGLNGLAIWDAGFKNFKPSSYFEAAYGVKNVDAIISNDFAFRVSVFVGLKWRLFGQPIDLIVGYAHSLWHDKYDDIQSFVISLSPAS